MRPAFLIPILWLVLLFAARAETIPSKPANYFNDYAGVVTSGTTQQLNSQLRQFERDTSNQIVVAIYKKMDTSSSVEDYTQRVAQSWKVGQADKNNGAVLFVFTEPRKMFIQVGYGLEGALPDILCKQIVENEIKPRFKAGDYNGGLKAGVDAMIKATRGEYKGTGRIHGSDSQSNGALIFVVIIILIVVFQVIQGWRRGTVYSSRGSSWGGGGFWFGGGGGSSGGGGGGGGFSGGGGSFGGGGAGGDW